MMDDLISRQAAIDAHGTEGRGKLYEQKTEIYLECIADKGLDAFYKIAKSMLRGEQE